MTLVPYELRKLIGSKLTVVLVLLLLIADIITCAVLNKPAELPDSAQSLIPAEELEKEEALIALGEKIYAEAPEATLAYYLDMDAQVKAYDEAFMDYVVNSHRDGTAVEPEEPIFAHTYSDEEDDYEVLSAFFGKVEQTSHYKENTEKVLISLTRTLEYLESFEGYADTYAYREQLALLSTYLDLHDYSPTLGIVEGWGALFTYQEGSIFLLLAILAVGSQIVLTDYTGQMTPILRTTSRGRFPTALAKLAVGLLAVLPIAALFTLAECGTVAWRLGLSDPFVAIQNIEGYLYCPYPITIFTALLWQYALRALGGIVFLAAMLLAARLSRRPIVTYAVGLVLFAANLLLHFFKTYNELFGLNAFTMASGLKDAGQATYLNLFGKPYATLEVTLLVMAVTALFVAVLYLVFATVHRGQPSRSPIRIQQKALEWVKTRLHIEKKAVERTVRTRKLRKSPRSLFFFEATKHLRARTVVLIAFIALVQLVYTNSRFSKPLTTNEELWETYQTQYAGELTDEKAVEIRALADYYALLRSESATIEIDESAENLEHDLEGGILRYNSLSTYVKECNLAYLREPVVTRLAEHIDYLEARAVETGVRGHLMKDTGLLRFMGQPMNIGLYLILLLVLSELFGYEGKFVPILRITRKGRAATWRSKLAFASLVSLAGGILFAVADWLCYLRYFDFEGLSAPLYSLADYSAVTSTVTVGQYLILLTALRIAGALLLGGLVAGLSGVLPSARVSLLASGALTLLPLALYFCGFDFMRYLDFTKLLSGNALWLLSWEQGGVGLLAVFVAVTVAVTVSLTAASYRKFCK